MANIPNKNLKLFEHFINGKYINFIKYIYKNYPKTQILIPKYFKYF